MLTNDTTTHIIIDCDSFMFRLNINHIQYLTKQSIVIAKKYLSKKRDMHKNDYTIINHKSLSIAALKKTPPNYKNINPLSVTKWTRTIMYEIKPKRLKTTMWVQQKNIKNSKQLKQYRIKIKNINYN